MEVAVFVFRLVLDRDLGGAEALLFNLSADKPAAWEAEGIGSGLNGGKVGARVDQRTERHVAADSAGAIEVSNSHSTASSKKPRDVSIVRHMPTICYRPRH